MPRPARPVHSATVTGSSRISRDMVRVTLACDSLPYADLEHTDHYVKLLFPPEGASYS